MKNLINRLMQIVRQFSVMDFAVFKVVLIAIGVILGVLFFNFFSAYFSTVCIILAVTLIYLIIKMIFYNGKA